jgi:hypothetical protein
MGDLAESLRESIQDIIVTRGQGREIFVKADDQVLLLDESDARVLLDELYGELEASRDE